MAASPGAAQDSGHNVELHAYGGWALGNSDPHPFVLGRGEGENVLGGRATVATPVEGLSFGLSAYQGEPETEEEPAPSWGDHRAHGLHVEYLAGAWGVRSEWARHEEEGELEHDARYLEVSYRLAEHWQIAGRFDQADLSFEEELDFPDSFLEHREIGFGLNYLYTDDLVIRLSYHHAEGNLFARPEGEELAEILAGEPVDETTRYLVLGAQFSF